MDQPISNEQPVVPVISAKSTRKGPIIIVVLLGILVGGGILAYSLVQKPANEESPTTSRKTITPSRTTGVTTPHYIGEQNIVLLDVSGGTASGAAIRSISSGVSQHSVYASLPDPPQGEFYQAWVVGLANDFITIGRLSMDETGVYSVISDYNFDPSDTFAFSDLFNTVIVTLEKEDNGVTGTKILEGYFTQ